MRPAGRGGEKPPARTPRDAAGEYRAKVAQEISRLSRRIRESGYPAPAGDPASGLMLVIEQPAGPRALQALDRSLTAIGLPEAYVTCAATGLLDQEILAIEPRTLIAIGPGAAREIDALDHPLVLRSFAGAETGVWFAWTRGTAGLKLPSLAQALDNEAAKRRFWRAFLALREFAPASPP